MRLKDKVAIVVGAGQTPGDGIGNGRAGPRPFCLLARVQPSCSWIAILSRRKKPKK
jgi:hypothetical protein